jgi:hypothetical protein
VFALKHYNVEKQYALNGAANYRYAMNFACRNGHGVIDSSIPCIAVGSGRVLLLLELLGGHNIFTTFQTYINHKVSEMWRNGSHCSKKKRWKTFVLVDCPVDSGAAQTYAADERKWYFPPAKATIVLW